MIALGLFLGSGAPAGASSHDGQCENAEYRQGAAAKLPDCRAYEQVSPQQKNGYDIKAPSSISRFGGGPTARDGDRIAFMSDGPFAGSEWGGSGAAQPYLSYLTTRDHDGWDTQPLLPMPNEIGLGQLNILRFSPDMSEYLLQTIFTLTDDDLPPVDYYRRSVYRRTATFGASTHLVSDDPSSSQTTWPLASRELATLLLDSEVSLSNEADQPANVKKVYELANGQYRLASRKPETNEPFEVETVFGGGSGQLEGAISEDGTRTYFTAPRLGNAEKIYRRTNGLTTALASPSQRTPVDPNGEKAKNFQAATPDGNRVFFLSAEELTDSADTGPSQDGMELYRYDFANDALIALSSASGSNSADVVGLIAINDAGTRAYFSSRATISGNGVAGYPNIYLWEDNGSQQGSIRYVTTVDTADEGIWDWGGSRAAEVSANGKHLVFNSVADINGVNPTGDSQVFLFDVAQATSGDNPLCISCPSPGSATDDARAVMPNGQLGSDRPSSMNTEGTRVVFSSPDPLAPQDTNGNYDAYIWADGQVHLLSSGRSGDDSLAYGMSASGDDAFFRTRERLVRGDVDTNVDVYTARVGGGLAAQQAPEAEACEGDECQGQVSAPPEPVSLSTDRTGVQSTPEASRCTRARQVSAGLTRRARRVAAKDRQMRQKVRTLRRSMRASGGPARTQMHVRTKVATKQLIRVRKRRAVVLRAATRANRAAKACNAGRGR